MPHRRFIRWARQTRFVVWLVFLAPPALAITTMIYWLYFEPPVLLPDAKEPWVLHLQNKIVEPGEALIATFYSCKRSDVTGNWNRTLVDTVEWNLVSEKTPLPLGCAYHAVVQLVPVAVPDGLYRLRLTADYQVNPLSSQHYEFTSDPFIVKRPAISAIVDAPPQRPINVIPEWNVNRDREIRERLHRLELWRYQVENKLK